jgi:hypothetical protein
MQLMPATALDYGVNDRAALFDPSVNIDTGVRHLRRLLRKYRHDYGRVLMAYNAGEGAVDRTNSSVRYKETLDYMETVARRYRRLGGTKPTDAILRKVAVLRQGSRHGKRRDDPAPPEYEDLLLPAGSPRLQTGIGPSRLDRRSPLGEPPRQRPPGRERSVSAGLEPGIDPAIRDVARPALLPRTGPGASSAARQR